jgi:hypothetical protein
LSLNEYERSLIRNVAEHGWHCTSVGSGDGAPGFTYSVGLWESLCTPELIIFGLGPKLMHQMLWEMFRQLKAGATLNDGERWSGVIDGFDCISRPVHHSQISSDTLNSAIWYREYRTGQKHVDAYQLFWPSLQGHYPWERNCDPRLRECQPPLYLPAGNGHA